MYGKDVEFCMDETYNVIGYYRKVTQETLEDLAAIRQACLSLRASGWRGDGEESFFSRVERMYLISQAFVRHLEATSVALEAAEAGAQPVRIKSEGLMGAGAGGDGGRIGIDYGECENAAREVGNVLSGELLRLEANLRLASHVAGSLNFAQVDVSPAQTAADVARGELDGLKERINTLVETTREWDYTNAGAFNDLQESLALKFDPLGALPLTGFSALVDAIHEKEAVRILRQLLDMSGNPNIDEITMFLLTNMGGDGLSEGQWQAMTQLFAGSYLSHQQVLEIFQDMSLRIMDIPTSQGHAHVMRQELALRVSVYFMQEVEMARSNGTTGVNEVQDRLRNLLRRSQLLIFTGEISPDTPIRVEHFDLDQFSRNSHGRILYGPRLGRSQFPVSGLEGLLGTSYGTSANMQNARAALGRNDSATAERVAGVAAKIFGGALNSGVMLTLDAISIAAGFAGSGEALSNAERAYAYSASAFATGMLGGGVASVATPNGYRVFGLIPDMREGRFREFALGEEFGYSRERAMEILMDENHDGHAEIYGFLSAGEYLDTRLDSHRPEFERRYG